jgi:chromosome segregation ATPase
VRPADPTAKILELNDSHKEEQTMSENEIKAIVSQVIAEMNSHADEIGKIKADYEEQIAGYVNMKAETDRFTSELNEQIADLKDKVEALEAANQALTAEKETMTSEMNALKSDLETAQKNKKIGELNKAIEGFSDEQKAYAQAEIDAFNENPLTSEINSVVDRIYAGIGRKSQEEEAMLQRH